MAKIFGMMRVGRDAEVRYTQDGKPVCNLGLAYNFGPKGEDGRRATQWIEGVLWEKRAEVLAPYLVKGSMHNFLIDDVRIETFKDRNDNVGHKLIGRVVDIELGPQVDRSAAPAAAAAPAPRQQAQRAAPAPAPRPASAPTGFDDMDDEQIPF